MTPKLSTPISSQCLNQKEVDIVQRFKIEAAEREREFTPTGAIFRAREIILKLGFRENMLQCSDLSHAKGEGLGFGIPPAFM